MTTPPAPLSKSQRKRRNKNLKSNVEGDDIKSEIEIPEPLAAHATGPLPVAVDSQCELAATTEVENQLDDISESDSEEISCPAIKIISKRIRLQHKKASRLAAYTLKPPSELNEDQKKSVAMLPIILANITELEGTRKAIESVEIEAAQELEKQRVEEEKAIQERINQAVSDVQESYLDRFSTIISLIRLSVHHKASGPSPLPLKSNGHRIMKHVGQSLTSFTGSQKRVLSGLLKGEGDFEGLKYADILSIAGLYRKLQTAEEIMTNREYFEDDTKGDLEELRHKLAELEREKHSWEETARKCQEEATRQIQIEISKRKVVEWERDRSFYETARKRKEEETRQTGIEEPKHELEQEPLWEEAAREQEEQEKRNRLLTEQCEAVKKRLIEDERELKRRLRQLTMVVHTEKDPLTREAMLKRYIGTANRFDFIMYTRTYPLKFSSIPWPVVFRTFSIREITWKAVQEFFDLMEGYLSSEEYENLVDESYKRFRPDEWRNRGILTSVEDDMEREMLEEAGSIVAMGLAPLWERVTRRE